MELSISGSRTLGEFTLWLHRATHGFDVAVLQSRPCVLLFGNRVYGQGFVVPSQSLCNASGEFVEIVAMISEMSDLAGVHG